MTQDEIIRMAREADIEVAHMKSDHLRTNEEIRQQWLERFAGLVAEATKEKAAKVCEEYAAVEPFSDFSAGHAKGAANCAAAIRSME